MGNQLTAMAESRSTARTVYQILSGSRNRSEEIANQILGVYQPKNREDEVTK